MKKNASSIFFLSFIIFFKASLIQAHSTDTCEKVFTKIYDNKVWGANGNGEGYSGVGSTLEKTVEYRKFLQNFLAEYNIKSVVDYGCGDWTFSHTMNWDGISYYGMDVVKSVLEKNRTRYGADNILFIHTDGYAEDLPETDLFISKDVLQHLPENEIFIILSKLHKFKYALITNDALDPKIPYNSQVELGGYRHLDITRPPYSVKAKKIFSFITDYRTKDVFLIDNTQH